jgi:AmmeMemoRadiSam system protein B
MRAAQASAPTRPAAFAGSWYPSDPGALADAVDGYLVPCGPAVTDPVALVSPHAGLMYSGPVAGRGYATLRAALAAPSVGGEAPERVAVLIGPSHYVAFDGVAAYPGGSFEAPLGRHPVDRDVVTRLAGGRGVVHVDAAVHAREHSLELQLPFLTRVLPGVPIVPLLMGRQSRTTVDALADDLRHALGDRRPLFIASSDLSHFYERPKAFELDSVVLDRIARFDADGLQDALERFPHHACGGGPIVAAMRAARAFGATGGQVIEYGDSGDVSGDLHRVVGYVSALLGRDGGAR